MVERFRRPTPRVTRALEVATIAHHGAVRKGTPTPYIEHPVAVALILESHGYPEDLVVAALLHDTVEDTNYGCADLQERLSRASNGWLPAQVDEWDFRNMFLGFLQREFGDRVFSLISAVTERKNDGSEPLDWLGRKKEQLNKLARASAEEAALKAADALHNIENTVADIEKLGIGVLDRFRGGPLLVWHYAAIAALAAERMRRDEPLAARVQAAATQLHDLVHSHRERQDINGPYPPPTVV